jgi:hypothetical protein
MPHPVVPPRRKLAAYKMQETPALSKRYQWLYAACNPPSTHTSLVLKLQKAQVVTNTQPECST